MDTSIEIPGKQHLPDLEHYFTPPRNLEPTPQTSAVATSAVSFLRRHQPDLDAAYCDKICRVLANGEIHYYNHPESDPEKMQLLADFMVWFTVFDDHYVENKTTDQMTDLAHRLLTLVRIPPDGASEPEPGPAAALGELFIRCASLSSRHRADIHDAVYSILIAWIWDAQTNAHRNWPTLETYKIMRPHCAGLWLHHALIEPASGLSLSDHDRNEAAYRRLAEAYVNINSWVNDVYSFTKETKDSKSLPISLPGVLMRDHGCTLEEAFIRAKEIIHNEADSAASAIDELSHSPSHPLREYAQCIGRILGCNLFFYTKSARDRYR
ncbi:terpene synthase family protein [Nocardia brasiliensis]|uniref:terpene synthase family protein n=1 Tax=Nocardia brasiliensis TaxID=37326 RepID=UPI0037B15B25